jgi:hypothetical protein
VSSFCEIKAAEQNSLLEAPSRVEGVTFRQDLQTAAGSVSGTALQLDANFDELDPTAQMADCMAAGAGCSGQLF